MTAQVEGLAGVEDIEEFNVFQEYVRDEVQRTVGRELAGLRERLRSVNLEAAKAFVNIKSFALPSLLATASQFIGISPLLSGAAGIAATISAVPLQARAQRRDAVRESPAGYLFQVGQELDSSALLRKVHKSLQC
ncbi:hypothetical protein HUO13_22700 [Saccharopolyspora erythraea]|uniref:hypothetical protein n=1 Tax=Saccharopolyspora erythraea TaxID=1836 RepID=UPI001BACC63E|nr:hypothetical protein [Saccharopolyspora erythraea]QUH03265.1 hypothetical protein HUO13_22700 [Saccharopolyspora erythraea]